MNLEKTKAQMRKGVLELCILSIISKKSAYASDILENLKQSELLIVEGTLYPLLTRLKNDGFLSYRWEESKSGPPRKYYELSPIGEKFLTELDQSWKKLYEAVNNIIESNKTNT